MTDLWIQKCCDNSPFLSGICGLSNTVMFKLMRRHEILLLEGLNWQGCSPAFGPWLLEEAPAELLEFQQMMNLSIDIYFIYLSCLLWYFDQNTANPARYVNLSTLFRRKHTLADSVNTGFELTLEEKLSLWKLRLPPQFPRFSMAFGRGSKPLKIACFNPVTEHFSVPHKPQFHCEKRCFWQSVADFQNDEKYISPWCDPLQKE